MGLNKHFYNAMSKSTLYFIFHCISSFIVFHLLILNDKLWYTVYYHKNVLVITVDRENFGVKKSP